MDRIPDNRLVIYPRAISARASMPDLLTVLRAAGLLGAEWPNAGVETHQDHYLVGEGFFEHISFLGCSPSLNVVPPADDTQGADAEFCHIGIDCSDEVKFLGGDNARAPQCTRCKTVDEDWRSIMPNWRKAPEVFTRQCLGCGATKPLHMFNWRRTAGFAAMSVHIWGVHQSEAVPSEMLLKDLETLTRCPWEYFYRSSK